MENIWESDALAADPVRYDHLCLSHVAGMMKKFVGTNIFLRYLTKDSYDRDFDVIEDMKREEP